MWCEELGDMIPGFKKPSLDYGIQGFGFILKWKEKSLYLNGRGNEAGKVVSRRSSQDEIVCKTQFPHSIC